MSTIAVRPLEHHDVAQASKLFARAFDNDRMARLIAPDPDQRFSFQEKGGRVQIERAMPYRHTFGAYEETALRGIAAWLPPGVAVRSSVRPPLSAVPRIVRAMREPGAISYVRERKRALAAVHKDPSWHLAFLATDPAHQRRGIGRKLLTHVLDRADADRTPTWLETSDPVNVPLYEKFGFVTTAHIDGGPGLPTFWVMVRTGRR